MLHYLIIDCEMGGRDIHYSLLTAYFLVTDENFKTLGYLDLKVKPDDGDYIVGGQGMGVNQINLQEHDKIAISYKLAKTVLYDFLKRYSNGSKLTPVGHGVVGDIKHLIDKLISRGSWEQFCTYHYIDTSVVLQFLRACGLMPMDCDGSVKALADHFKLTGGTEDWHSAKTDAKMTAHVLKEMINLVRSKC